MLTTELRLLGREGRLGAVEVAVAGEVAGLPAEGEVVVIAVEAAGLPAVGAVDRAFPTHESQRSGRGSKDETVRGRSLHDSARETYQQQRLLSPTVWEARPTP